MFAALAILLAGWIDRHNGLRLGALIPAALAVGNVAILLVFGVAGPARYLLPTVVLAYVAGLAMLAPTDKTRLIKKDKLSASVIQKVRFYKSPESDTNAV